MIVNEVILSKLVPVARARAKNISPYRFAQRVRNFYCPLMTRDGLCTRVCQNCAQPIMDALDGVSAQSEKPDAVFVWRLRGAVAIQKEKQSQAEKSPVTQKDEYGVPLEVNIMSELSAMFT